MAGNADNIIVGAAEVQIDGTDVGYTQGGVSVRYESEVIDIFADQAVGVVKKARSSERMFVTTTLLEATLSQIRRAFMIPSAQLSVNSLTLGYNNACWVEELAITLIGFGTVLRHPNLDVHEVRYLRNTRIQPNARRNKLRLKLNLSA